MNPIGLAEKGLVPDALLRAGIRNLLRRRLAAQKHGGVEAFTDRYRELLDELRTSPIARDTEAANRQHYELPPAFFELILGKALKYSGCLFADGADDLDAAERAMLGCYAERARLRNGQRVLDLGCGWGSLSLWLARRHPESSITAVSNSVGQGEFIRARAAERGLGNLEVITADVNAFSQPPDTYDRIVSVEMFEHVRNYAELLDGVADWIKPDGLVFVHIFCHHRLMYPFLTDGPANWLGRHFFTGGLMPAFDTLLNFQHRLALDERWAVSGSHYERTANAWLDNLDANRARIRSICADVYGDDKANLWVQRWRMFFMACAELFGYNGGDEWLIGHYRFKPRNE